MRRLGIRIDGGRAGLRRLMNEIDDDKSGEIEFDEFTALLQRADGGCSQADQPTYALLPSPLTNPLTNLLRTCSRIYLFTEEPSDQPGPLADGLRGGARTLCHH